ncbi:MAG: AAA domain-containing protein [Chitinivibrionales bacterium]|nr:AAA domain-containing protein [Chitinivibrionales bacterium]
MQQKTLHDFYIRTQPNYVVSRNEPELFRCAFRNRIPLIVKGPTGCGKTRFIEHMAYELTLPLITVSCHEDLTAADLVGRFLFRNDETVWQDGPLTMAVRHGAICYLDEIVEARKDTTVIIHSLTDHRRMLYLDKTGEVLEAHANFMLVMSYNPGYQSIVKDLKQSTKQRFGGIVFDYPSVTLETDIIASETGLDRETSRTLADMGAKVRELKGFGLDEGASTRLLVYMGRLIESGLPPIEAARCAIGNTITDDPQMARSINDIVQLYFGELDSENVA